MAENRTGLSLDLIIHPGETVKEYLDETGMTQSELAIRTGVSEKHISKVVSGQSGISAVFAKKLEYATGASAKFWLDLQAQYDLEMMRAEELKSLSPEEEALIRKEFKEIDSYLAEKHYVNNRAPIRERVLEYRELLNISNLLDIPGLKNPGIHSKDDAYRLTLWKKLCDLEAENNAVTVPFSAEKLTGKLPAIRKCMSLKEEEIPSKLKEILKDCGISFVTVKPFHKIAARTYIFRKAGKVNLCMTLEKQYADMFWSSLFQDLGFILHNDLKREYIDAKTEEEETFAADILVPDTPYKEFLEEKGYSSLKNIGHFSKTIGAEPFAVIGRLLKDRYIDQNQYIRYRKQYRWKEE